MDILSKIQVELIARKNQRNNFGNYNYRSCEDILEGLKPLLKKYECSVILSDDIKMIGDRIYVVSTATLRTVSEGGSIHELATATAFAREPLQQKGMNEAQVTGSASSYARKYALNGLFAIDDNKDADTDEHRKNADNRPSEPSISEQIRNYLNSGKMPADDVERYKSELNSKVIKADKHFLDRLIYTYGAI